MFLTVVCAGRVLGRCSGLFMTSTARWNMARTMTVSSTVSVVRAKYWVVNALCVSVLCVCGVCEVVTVSV